MDLNKAEIEMPDVSLRTVGDGMDNSLITLSDFINKNLGNFKISRIDQTLRPIIPEGPIIKTVPKYIPKERKKPRYLIKKPKEPKFVPYEPFKGAVDPIVPRKKLIKIDSHPCSKNNVDIQDLVFQMSEMRSMELNKVKIEALEKNEIVISMKEWEKEKQSYETDIKNLQGTNSHLENQLKFQAQVNSELKTLLVAAVGEDLESRVQHLTEDKLQLARALLNSANHLTSHQEQTEWLSGQCEVWRSKFLASSLMVEELARWKSALSNRINELQENIKILMDERTKARNYSLKSYNLLVQINETLSNSTISTIRSANIIDINLNNYKLVENIAKELCVETSFKEDLLKLSGNTPGEKIAIRLMKSPVSLTYKPDAICDALKGAANRISGQMFLQHPNSHATCCKHCKGEILDM